MISIDWGLEIEGVESSMSEGLGSVGNGVQVLYLFKVLIRSFTQKGFGQR